MATASVALSAKSSLAEDSIFRRSL
jgi:hypothetical protein